MGAKKRTPLKAIDRILPFPLKIIWLGSMFTVMLLTTDDFLSAMLKI
jgi:hypothetical protein